MTEQEKRAMIVEMCAGLQKTMLDNLTYTPPAWNGFELRQWLVDLSIERYVMPMDAARLKAYKQMRFTDPRL